MTSERAVEARMTPQRALLHVLNAIEDRGGIHNRFMPDLVVDVIKGLAEHEPPFTLAASPAPDPGADEVLP